MVALHGQTNFSSLAEPLLQRSQAREAEAEQEQRGAGFRDGSRSTTNHKGLRIILVRPAQAAGAFQTATRPPAMFTASQWS